MYDSPHNFNDDHEQSSLYDDLSHLLKIFKKIITYVDNLMIQFQQDYLINNNLTLLKQLLHQNNTLINKYNHSLQPHSPHHNTFYRFICRLNQNLATYRHRPHRSQFRAELYQEFLSRTAFCIESYPRDKNLGKIYKKIFDFTLKLCQSVQISNQNKSNQNPAILFKKQIQHQQQTLHNEYLLTKGKSFFSQSQTNFHKVMSGLSKRYNTLSCLDIDYNEFKADFYQSKNQNNELYNDFFTRNLPIWRQIMNYSKAFQDYLKRRQKNTLLRRNRFRQLKSNETVTEVTLLKRQERHKTINSSNQSLETLQKQINLQKHSPLKHQKETSLNPTELTSHKKKQFEKQQKTAQNDKRKTCYQLKNIYLTLNKLTSDKFDKRNNKNIIKLNRQKIKNHAAIKIGKFSLKSTKYIQQTQKRQNRMLDIKHYDFYQNQLSYQQRTLIHQLTKNSNQTEKQIQDEHQRSNLFRTSQKKQFRVTQSIGKTANITKYIKKNSVTQGNQLLYNTNPNQEASPMLQ